MVLSQHPAFIYKESLLRILAAVAIFIANSVLLILMPEAFQFVPLKFVQIKTAACHGSPLVILLYIVYIYSRYTHTLYFKYIYTIHYVIYYNHVCIRKAD